MSKMVIRKCTACGEAIIIDPDNVHDLVYFKKVYYHERCFRELAIKRSSRKNSSPDWKEALDDNLSQVKKDAEYMINYGIGHNALYDHIVEHYDVVTVPPGSKRLMEDVVGGEYKGKSKPIPYRDFAQCWIELQKDIDKIYSYNKQNGKQMTTMQRLNYDLAVVVGRYPDWKKAKEKHKAEVIEQQNKAKENIKIDYSRIKSTKNDNGVLDDISDLLDDLI